MTSSDLLRVLLVIALVVYVIGRQLRGEPLQHKRVVVLPAILGIIGLSDLFHAPTSPTAADIALLTVGGLVAAGIGVAQGLALHLERRDGHLWGRLPLSGLWLWGGLLVSRLVLTGIAAAGHAHVAASATSALLVLGVNRLAQAGVIVARANAAGIPFAPDGGGLRAARR